MVFSFDDFEINMTMMERPRQGFHVRDWNGYSKAFISLMPDGEYSISDGFMVFTFDRYEMTPESKQIVLSRDGSVCGLIKTEGCNVGDLEESA